MKNRTFVLLLVGATLVSAPRPAAQVRVEYTEEAERQFRAAVMLYDAGVYRDAAFKFDRIIRDFPAGHRITAAFVMKGKAFYKAGENLEAAKAMKSFLSRFPSSGYAPDAEYVLGCVYNKIERHEEATEMLLSAYRRLTPSSPERLVGEIRAALDVTIDSLITLPLLRSYLSRAALEGERAYLWFKIAEKEAARENTVAAGIALDSLMTRYPSQAYAARLTDLRSHVAARSSVKLGILLPLLRNSEPSAVKEVGNDVYDGVLYAIEQYGREPDVRVAVSLETRDTEREPRLATKGAQELCDDRDVLGIIGPVFSATVTSAAAVANARGVPLVTPTANANGLVVAGKYVFQANPDYDTRGRAMARYAVLTRGFRSVAVLAPVDAYGRFLGEGFVREAERLGARVLGSEGYQRGSPDLKQPLAKLRRAGMLAGADAKLSFGGRMRPQTLMKFVDLGVPLKRLDSLMSSGGTVSARTLLGPRARVLLDSLSIPVIYDESRVDSLEYPVDAIEGLYVPIGAPEEIGVVSSQVVYFNFQTQLLGSGEWNNFAELNANRRYCDGVEFESDTYVDTTGGNYTSFVGGFTARFKKRPTKNTLFGYDTAAMMLELIRTGATTREALQRALAGLREFRGYHSKIGLDGGRVNSWLTVLQYTKDEIRKVGEVRAEPPPEGGGSEEKRGK